MHRMARRPAIALGLAAGAGATPATGGVAQMPMPGPGEGQEVAPGVRLVQYGKGPAIVPDYKSLSLYDVVFQPGSELPSSAMKNAMLCHIAEGELRVMQEDSKRCLRATLRGG
jgi:hypothetical protein